MNESDHYVQTILLGMDSAWRTNPASASLIVDMSQDVYGAWRKAGGANSIYTYSDDATIFDGAGPVDSIFWWSQHGGARQWLVFEQTFPELESYLYYQTGQDYNSIEYWNSPGNRFATSAPWQHTQYLATAGWLYFCNGIEDAQRWNGEYGVQVGFYRPPPAPNVWSTIYDIDLTQESRFIVAEIEEQKGLGSALAASGITPVTSTWVYGWAISYVNDRGMESPLSSLTFVKGKNQYLGTPPVTVVDETKTSFKAFAFVSWEEAPVYVAAVRLYRTSILETIDQHALVYLHSEYLSGMPMRVSDGIPDTQLGALYDNTQTGVTPSRFKYMSLFKNTLFLSGFPDEADKLQYSAPGLIEQFPVNNYFNLGNRDGGEPRGMYATKNALVVFKENGIYLIKGDPASGFFAETLTEDIGSSAPNALVEAPGMGLLFVSISGIYLLEGALENTGTPTNVRHIGKPIQQIWDQRVNRSALITACAVHNQRDHEIWIQVPSGGKSRPNLGFVYHYQTDSWSLRENYPINCFTSSRDHRNYVFYGTWEPEDGMPNYGEGVQVYSHGFNTKNAEEFESTYRSVWCDFGSVWTRTQVRHLQLYGLNLGNHEFDVNYRVDRHQGFEEATETRTSLDSEGTREFWGTALWDTGVWWDYDPTVVTMPIAANALEFQYQVSGDKLHLISSDVEVVAPKSGTDIRKLDTALRGNR